jgi:hypothetical protein
MEEHKQLILFLKGLVTNKAWKFRRLTLNFETFSVANMSLNY